MEKTPMKTIKRITLLFVAVWLLAGCGEAPAAPTATPVLTPTLTPFSPPTDTPVPTITLTPTMTRTPTVTLTLMPSLVRTRSAPTQYTYVFPVQPAIYTGFSEGGHGYPATDIFAPMTEYCCEFVAPTSGYVEAVSYNDNYDPNVDDPELRGGIFVSIIGDDGVRYYGAHLSRVADGIWVNLEVEAGQTLGWVGMSGSANGTLPHLHFGISHPTDPDDWETRRGEIDPYPYLVRWLAGENVTPDLRVLTPTPWR
jgi:hypothetical protein